MIDFLNGAVGGERGCEAALLNFRLAVEMAAAFDDGESRKTRKPKERTAARTIVTGLVRRRDRGKAMLVK